MQPSQRDRDDASDRGFGSQAAGCRERVEAVTREFIGRNVIADSAGPCAFDEQGSEEFGQLLLCSVDMLASMQKCRKVVSVVLVDDQGVCVQHSFEALARVAGLIADFGEMLEVVADVTFVPRGQDRFDVREVLVQRRTSDTGFLGDLRHRH